MNFIEEIKEKLPINKVLGYYLEKRKDIYWTHKYTCPFHANGEEKTPSLYADDDKKFFYCFWCKKSGDIISFVRDYDKDRELSFMEAIEELKDNFPEELNDVEIKWNINDKTYKYKKLIYEFHDEVNNEMIKSLNKKENESIKLYLTNQRKLSEDTIKNFWIWFSKEMEIVDFSNKLLKTDKYKEIKKEDTWLYSNKNGLYFLFSDRIMYPIRNWRWKIVGWSWWRIHEDQNPKYINSVNNFIYNKSTILFNLDKVKFRETNTIVICEWNLDSTQLYNYGANNAVSLLWTNLTDSQINLFKNKVKKAILLLDNDEAGGKAIMKITKQLLSVWIIPYIVNIAPYKDIDDFLKNHEELKGKINEYLEKNKMDILWEYLIKWYVLNKDKFSLEKRYEILSIVKETYASIKDDVIRQIYKEELEKYNIEFENLETEYLEKKKEIEKKRKNADKENQKKISLDDNSEILYLIYFINKGELELEYIQLNNPFLAMKITNEKYKKYIWDNDLLKQDFPELLIQFDLLWNSRINEII